jgi:hypothetical protein
MLFRIKHYEMDMYILQHKWWFFWSVYDGIFDSVAAAEERAKEIVAYRGRKKGVVKEFSIPV